MANQHSYLQLCCAILCYCAATGCSAVVHSRIGTEEIAEGEIDFGVVAPGVTCSHEFTITNGSLQTLSLAQITTSCSCTAARLESDTIGPGDSAELQVKLDVGSKEVNLHQRVIVEFANGEIREFSLRAQVRNKLYVDTERIDRFRDSLKANWIGSFSIVNHSGSHWPAPSVSHAPEWIKVNLVQIEDAEVQSWRCDLLFDSDVAPSHSLDDFVEFSSPDSQLKQRVGVSLLATPEIAVKPAEVRLGRSKFGQIYHLQLLVTFSPEALGIVQDSGLRLTIDGKEIEHELLPLGGSLVYSLTFNMDVSGPHQPHCLLLEVGNRMSHEVPIIGYFE